ncbi:hypothetical protein [Streptomyces scopuliridis]
MSRTPSAIQSALDLKVAVADGLDLTTGIALIDQSEEEEGVQS